jgi:regulator of replication initiation timing
MEFSQELRTLTSDNTRLKAENNKLRRDIERIQPGEISNETILQDRLYQSNKALQ